MAEVARQVHLEALEITKHDGGTIVRMIFVDNDGHKHIAVNTRNWFLVCLEQLMQRARMKRQSALGALDMFPGRGRHEPLWFITFTDGVVGNLGELDGHGAINDLQMMLHEQNRTAHHFRDMLVRRQPYVYRNHFRT